MVEKNKEEIHARLVKKIIELGYPEEFGIQIAKTLSTEKAMMRMLSYLQLAKPSGAEEIADEMLAICADRDRYVRKKKAEYYNRKYNELLWNGRKDEENERN